MDSICVLICRSARRKTQANQENPARISSKAVRQISRKNTLLLSGE
jgi:hypothetical protein